MPTPKNVNDIAGMLKRGEDVHIPGVGKLKLVDKKARTARNPQTGATVNVPARKDVKFSLSSVLKEELKGPVAA